ncbi:MAG TPA: hypothetical protein VN040_16525 [Pseudosphingobacterium sp.]|nr:hypothetical protein [Pseudosphingobacterium sp.]
MKKNILKSIAALTFIAVTFTACNKSELAEPKLALEQETAVIPVGGTQAGGFTNSATTPSASGWGSVGYSLFNNAVSSTGNEVVFNQNFNGNITEVTGYNLGYVDLPSISNVSAVQLTNLTSTNWSITTLGSNGTVAGWYNYDPTARTITPVANRYAVVANNTNLNTATRVYVVQLTSIVGTGTGPYFTDVDFSTKRLK